MKFVVFSFAVLAALSAGGCANTGLLVGHAVGSIAGKLQIVQENDWEPKKQYTVHPWFKNNQLIAEQTKSHIHHRAERYTANGEVTSLTDEKLKQQAEQLLAMHLDFAQFELPGADFYGNPRYFMERRLFMVSAAPLVLVSVPFVYMTSRGVVLKERIDSDIHDFFNAQAGFYTAEMSRGIRSRVIKLEHWRNNIELSAVIPKANGTQVMASWWPQPEPLESALLDTRWNFVQRESSQFPGYLELSPREAQPSGTQLEF